MKPSQNTTMMKTFLFKKNKLVAFNFIYIKLQMINGDLSQGSLQV